MNLFKTVIFGTSMLLTASFSYAGDAAAGKSKAAACAACHGVAGISAMDIWPNLAGQKEGYLDKQLKAFRDGNRTDPVMGPMAKPLSDGEIADLAAYFSSLK